MNQPGWSLSTILQVIPDEKMTNEEIQAKYQQQIALIEENHTKTLNSLIWKYERQLKEKQQVFETSQKESETLYQQVVQREIDLLKNSWTWKIGFAQTSAIRLAINFLKNPVRFFKSQQYRWHNIYFYQ